MINLDIEKPNKTEIFFVRLTKHQANTLRNLSKKHTLPVSTVIRELIDKALNKK